MSDGEAPVLNIWKVGITQSLPLLPGSLWPGMVVPVRNPSTDQIDMFKIYLYLIRPCAPHLKTNLKKQQHKKDKPECTNL